MAGEEFYADAVASGHQRAQLRRVHGGLRARRTRRPCSGIASGPVTDWKLYDTIYTERYMLTPNENPEGYKKSRLRIAAAKNLNGKLLIIHGMMDDNVHVQNSRRSVADALQKGEQGFPR